MGLFLPASAFIFALVACLALYELYVFREIYTESKRNKREISPSAIPLLKNEEKAVSIFSKALQFETTDNIENIQAFWDCVDHLHESFPNLFSYAEKVDHKFSGSAVVYRIPGTNSEKDPVILMSHIDVVPASSEDKWTAPPFSGMIQDGYIYGRGTLDNKINTISALQAFELILENEHVPERTFFFSITFDEESRGEGAMAVVEYFKGIRLKPFLILDEGGCLYRNSFKSVPHDVALVSVNEKAGSLLNITVFCEETGHVSFSKADNCVDIISEAVQKIKKFRFPSHSTYSVLTEFIESVFPHSNSKIEFIFFSLFRKVKYILDFFFNMNKVMGSLIRTTQIVSMLRVGEIYNVLPDKGYFIVDVRRFPGDTLEFVKEELVGLIQREGIQKIDVQVIWSKDNQNTAPVDSDQFRLLKKSIEETFENVVVAPFILPGGTDLQYFKVLSDFTFNFSPMVIDDDLDDLSRTHGIDERISVKNYIEAIQFYERLILKLDSFSP